MRFRSGVEKAGMSVELRGDEDGEADSDEAAFGSEASRMEARAAGAGSGAGEGARALLAADVS